jgi:hypothetical protein
MTSAWSDRVLKEFPADLARLWIAADPDDVLLDEPLLAGLRERGFEVVSFEDSIVFRAEYEERYRAVWDRGEAGPAKALVLHLRGTEVDKLPWDYLQQARRVSLSLADLFPKLSYGVVRQLGAEHLEALFDAQTKYASQVLGDAATKEFALLHVFQISPHLIAKPENLWEALLRLHYRGDGTPPVLARHIAHVLAANSTFNGLPIAELFSSRSVLLRTVQDAWYSYLADLGITGTRVTEPAPLDVTAKAAIPFEHSGVRVMVDSLFLDGLLHPLAVRGSVGNIPEWAKVGVVQDPAALRTLVQEGIKALKDNLPAAEASHRDWTSYARRLGELMGRFHTLDTARAKALQDKLAELQSAVDDRLREWLGKHYTDLASLPVAKAPVMVHQVPRFLSLRRGGGETKIALLVFDGLAVDQWVQIRESLAERSPTLAFDENACFAWLPTLTSVSRQALFSGLRPREFAESIESTAQEPSLWSRFWQDQLLRANEVLYRKGLKHSEQLAELDAALASPSIKVAGIVVDMVDEIVHTGVLGKRGIAKLIGDWCESGFVAQLFEMLLDRGFHVYVTADHGNVEAVGQGRPKQGDAPEAKGERVRIYRSEALAADSASSIPSAFRQDSAGLPANYLPLFAAGRTAFVPQGERVVVHGGLSIEELIVPFVKVSYASPG